jgi:hypothetical protein
MPEGAFRICRRRAIWRFGSLDASPAGPFRRSGRLMGQSIYPGIFEQARQNPQLEAVQVQACIDINRTAMRPDQLVQKIG